MNIRITIGDLEIPAKLNETPTAKMILAALPFQASFDVWGDEIYFTIPVQAELEETAVEEVQMGDLAYWPPGKAFCIFFGPTPMSTGDRIVPASAVNVVGRVTGDAGAFKKVMHESRVTVRVGVNGTPEHPLRKAGACSHPHHEQARDAKFLHPEDGARDLLGFNGCSP